METADTYNYGNGIQLNKKNELNTIAGISAVEAATAPVIISSQIGQNTSPVGDDETFSCKHEDYVFDKIIGI